MPIKVEGNGYFSQYVYQPKEYKKLIKQAIQDVKHIRKLHPFDAIAFRGFSGAALAYPVAGMLEIPLLCIRKEKSHHAYHAYNNLDGYSMKPLDSYLIVDDFTASGNTIKTIIEHCGLPPAAIYLYRFFGSKKLEQATWRNPIISGSVPIFSYEFY